MKNWGIVCALCCASLASAGCATSQGATGSISPIAAQADDFKVTVAQGALAGALVGGLTGALTGKGDAKRIVEGALIGGAVGAAGGYVVAGQKQSYARKEDALNAIASDCEARNQKLTTILSTTDQVIVRRRTELASLQKSQATTQEKLNAKKALLSELEADKLALDQAIASARDHGHQIDSNIVELKKQFPDDKPSAADQIASTYHRNAGSLQERQKEIYRMIDDSSKIRVES